MRDNALAAARGDADLAARALGEPPPGASGALGGAAGGARPHASLPLARPLTPRLAATPRLVAALADALVASMASPPLLPHGAAPAGGAQSAAAYGAGTPAAAVAAVVGAAGAPSTVTRDFASGALIALANVGGERAAGGAARGALIAVRPALLAMAARDEFAADLVLNQLRHVYG